MRKKWLFGNQRRHSQYTIHMGLLKAQHTQASQRCIQGWSIHNTSLLDFSILWLSRREVSISDLALSFLVFAGPSSSCPLHGSQPWDEEACVTQWSYGPCGTGPPKMDVSLWRVLTKHGPLAEGTVNHSSVLASRIPWTVWKGKKIWHLPQVGRCPICSWGRREKQIQKEWRGWAKAEMMLSCGYVWWWK